MEGRDPDYYAALVDRLFCSPDARYGPFVRIGPPNVVIPDLIVRVRVQRPGDESDTFELSIFDGIDGFAGELWEHEVRSLLRLEALDHPALPKIRTGGYDDSEKIAFTLTVDTGTAINLDEALEWAGKNPVGAFEQFSVLLDALSHLHGSRILHRNLTVGALRVETSQGNVSITLSRFELSTLIGNILRQVSGQPDNAAREMVRELYLTPPAGVEKARHLAYLAPETHSYLFGAHIDTRNDWETTDIFGMGVLGWEWFCGPIPELLPVEYAAVRAATGSEEDTAASTAQATGLEAALAALHQAMRAHLTYRTDIARPLTKLLRNMLDARPSGRHTSIELSHQLESNWEAIRAVWEPDAATKPYLVAFMPTEAIDTIYEKRHWIARSPEDSAGRDDLKIFLDRELRQAELVRSPTGAGGYATGPEQALREAEWVLIGERALWFCAFFYQQSAFGGRTEPFGEILLIKYLMNKELAPELAQARPRRRVGKIDLIAYRVGQDIIHQRAGRPSWHGLTESISHGRRTDRENLEFLQSLDFLLEYQRAVLEARQYPYVRLDASTGPGATVIRVDTSRDDARQHRSPMLSAYSRDAGRRPPFGDFFSEPQGDEESVRVDLVGGNTPAPFFGGRRIIARVTERYDIDTIRVAPEQGAQVPETGWVRRTDDAGSRTQLDRQLRARIALDRQAGLVRNLREPMAIDLGRGRWSDRDEGSLNGNAPQLIRDMLAYQPFYALQGPPGSGKTTVAARAIKHFLEAEAGARVLVSAQSNFALDNIGKRLIKELPRDTLVLRVTAEQGDAPRRPIDRHTLEALTKRLAQDVGRRLGRPAARSALSDRERVLAEDWLACLESNQVELGDRIRTGASVVLATCSMAATVLSGTRDTAEMFDWVLVEEAAKAWPTEVVVPLVLGARWTLIGDHRQLGPHRGRDVERFLESLEHSTDDDMRRHYSERKARLATLKMFESLFEKEEKEGDSTPPGGHVRPTARLTMQFRMHKNIAEPVSRTFYPTDPAEYDTDQLPESFLRTDDEANRGHGVIHPVCLKGSPLVWIDTTHRSDCQDKRQWSNVGEARLIAALAQRMDPPPAPPDRDDDDENTLAVLTPYRAQLMELESWDALKGRVHTVHSFQGREADRVIVSLVRSTVRGQLPSSNVGFVGEAEVANVLLSRARRLGILVGSRAHFAEHGGDAWATIAAVFARYGTVIDARELEVP